MMMYRLVTSAFIFLLAACSGGESGASADEYAVWSAAVDAAFGGTEYRRLSLDAVSVVPMTDGARMENLLAGGLPAEVARSYAARNTVQAHVRASHFTTRRVNVLAPMPEWTRALMSRMDVLDGGLMVSRPGFDRSRSRAVVMVVAQCGNFCGVGKTLMMERGSDGSWRQAAILEDWKS